MNVITEVPNAPAEEYSNMGDDFFAMPSLTLEKNCSEGPEMSYT